MAYMGNTKCFTSESPPLDPPGKDVLRAYSARFSPYTERVKLVLHAKGIEHETINVHLANKPNWFKDKNPNEMLPVIEINDRIIYDSVIISNYLDASYPGRKLTTADPYKRALEEMALDGFKPALAAYFRYIFATDDQQKAEKWTTLKTCVPKLVPLLEKGNSFLCGDQPGMTDFMVWPFLERLGLDASSMISEQPLLQAYFDRMGKNESVIACRVPGEMLQEFHKLYHVGNKDWDYGLE